MCVFVCVCVCVRDRECLNPSLRTEEKLFFSFFGYDQVTPRFPFLSLFFYVIADACDARHEILTRLITPRLLSGEEKEEEGRNSVHTHLLKMGQGFFVFVFVFGGECEMELQDLFP